MRNFWFFILEGETGTRATQGVLTPRPLRSRPYGFPPEGWRAQFLPLIPVDY